MSDTLATYSFLPWLRQGIANSITQTDNDNSVKLRASVPVRLTVSATTIDNNTVPDKFVNKTIEVYGPGDIIGIDSKAIVKTEPRNWITNFEPNYLPYIDFYEEDFPWRYTPARQSIDRLRPWLTLVVLKEDEFEEGRSGKTKPLPYFKLKDGVKTLEIFPKPSELWAWAHVHVNTDLSGGAAPNAANASNVTAAITTLIQSNPDQAYSRILSPRKLESDKSYHAFLIPTFESGRLAGLDYDIPSDLAATKCGWDDENHIEFPYYHRWYFRTGAIGDFEYLVNLLQPKPANKNVGVRDIDVLHPGSNLPAIDNVNLKGILKLGGALRVPFDTQKEEDKAEIIKYDRWDEVPQYPHKFTTAMAKRVNLADDYVDDTTNVADVNKGVHIMDPEDPAKGDPDPVITSPLYGRWHALQQRLLIDKSGNDLPHYKNWVHELNLDPRFRVAAALGTRIIQKGQEEYMQAAWEQVGNIIEANNKLRLAQLVREISLKIYQKHLLPLQESKISTITAPVQKRILYQNLTIHKTAEESAVPPAVFTGNFRSITRPGGPVMKKLVFSETIRPENLVQRIASGDLVIVPPKIDPPGAIKLVDAASAVQTQPVPPLIRSALKKYKWFRYVPFIVLVLLALFIIILFPTIIGWSVLAVAAGAAIWLYNKIKSWETEMQKEEAVSQDSQAPDAVDDFPASPNFKLSNPGENFSPALGSTDSVEARNFKTALKDAYTVVSIPFSEPDKKPFALDNIASAIKTSLNPSVTIPLRIGQSIKIPARLSDNMVETFAPVMAYPEIDKPMYRPLADLSSELFLPNINLIEQNSITLLENNQKFIESYMVGLNHEMSRELLWREYPTDQRGSYLRQFWDVTSFLPPSPVPPDIKEKLRDIPKIHEWSTTNEQLVNSTDPQSPRKNELGQHNLRALESGKTQLVLVIRGELLKKYPTAVVYAHKADWGLNSSNVRDLKEERRFIELTDAEKANPPLEKIKTPLFEAKVEPDIYFFGFDLDDEEARGPVNPASVNENAGWFFVIKERPGEPRFGLDIQKAKNEIGEERIINWNNLSWPDIETIDGSCIQLNKTIGFQSYNAGEDQENKPNADDVQARWSPDTNSAELAYILYQVPVLVGVHASRMLPK